MPRGGCPLNLCCCWKGPCAVRRPLLNGTCSTFKGPVEVGLAGGLPPHEPFHATPFVWGHVGGSQPI
eukprot:5659523-Alexandrium_andersonii.AAC.1